MTAAPSHAMLLALGEDLAWPSVKVGSLTIVGLEDWRAAAAAATPPERQLCLEGLAEPLLTCTPHARARLEAWRLSPIRLPATEEWIRENILFYGDATMLDPVLTAFLCMPEPVREYVLGECAFLGVGRDTYAWTGSSNFVDQNGNHRPRIIVLSGADRHAAGLVRAALHEASHVWTTPTPSALVTCKGEEGFRTYMDQEGLTKRLDSSIAFDERIACALAALWASQGGW